MKKVLLSSLSNYRPVFGMSNVPTRKTGQPFTLWVDSAGVDRNPGHNEIRVKAEYNNVEVEVGFQNGEYSTFKTTKQKLHQFKKQSELKEYVTKMKKPLIMHWNHELTDGEFERVCVFVKRGKSVDEAVQLVISDREDDE